MTTKDDETRAIVRDHYAKIAEIAKLEPARPAAASCAPGCCGTSAVTATATTLGYTDDERAGVPDGADLGLGCGNPTAIAALREGETVLDLGAGGGFDCFIAARQVGPTGRVIGVDMTSEMVSLARTNATKVKATNVEFRLGEIEHLPVADRSVDAILSNCVVNLAPDKRAVYAEAFRVLKPGGRLAISDVVAIAPIPEELQQQAAALAGCIAGAAPIDDVRTLLAEVGFVDVRVEPSPRSAEVVGSWLAGADRYIASATIEAHRPSTKTCCGPECCA